MSTLVIKLNLTSNPMPISYMLQARVASDINAILANVDFNALENGN